MAGEMNFCELNISNKEGSVTALFVVGGGGSIRSSPQSKLSFPPHKKQVHSPPAPPTLGITQAATPQTGHI